MGRPVGAEALSEGLQSGNSRMSARPAAVRHRIRAGFFKALFL